MVIHEQDVSFNGCFLNHVLTNQKIFADRLDCVLFPSFTQNAKVDFPEASPSKLDHQVKAGQLNISLSYGSTA